MAKRALPVDGAPAPSGPSAADEPSLLAGALHPLLAILPCESPPEIDPEAEAALNESEHLNPGLNCCAVCASACENDADLVKCTSCHRVGYCSEAHRAKDAAYHGRNCVLLSHVALSESIPFDEDQQRLGLALLQLDPTALPRVESWADVVMGDACAAVWEAKLPEAAGQPAKRRRVAFAAEPLGPAHPTPPPTPAAAAAAVVSLLASAATTPQPSSTPSHPSSSSSLLLLRAPAPSEPDARFRLAALLAVASSYATYPLSALHILRGCEAGRTVAAAAAAAAAASAAAAAQRSAPSTSAAAEAAAAPAPAARSERRHLVLGVLGASDSAELAHLDVWKVLAGCGGEADVVLQFVGPEVPAELHNTARPLADKLTATFWRGQYEDLMDEAVMAAADLAVARHLPPAAAGAPATPTASAKLALLPLLQLLPDAFFGFNMGLTCPDYGWQATLDTLNKVAQRKATAAAQAGGASAMLRLPLFTATNTIAEAVMEEEVLAKQGWHTREVVRRNPLASLETLQSGTFGNDLYRKNAWMASYELRVATKERGGGKRAGKKGGVVRRLGGWLGRAAARLLPRALLPKGHRKGGRA